MLALLMTRCKTYYRVVLQRRIRESTQVEFPRSKLSALVTFRRNILFKDKIASDGDLFYYNLLFPQASYVLGGIVP